MAAPEPDRVPEPGEVDRQRRPEAARPKDGYDHLIFLSLMTPDLPSSDITAANPRRVEPSFIPHGRPFAEPALR